MKQLQAKDSGPPPTPRLEAAGKIPCRRVILKEVRLDGSVRVTHPLRTGPCTQDWESINLGLSCLGYSSLLYSRA